MTHSHRPVADRLVCRCGTELSPQALACPACLTIVHADKLKALAADASDLTARGELIDARGKWEETLELFPPESQQHAVIRGRVAELTKRIAATPAGDGPRPKDQALWWKRGLPGLIALLLLFAGKLKFLVLGLTKASTFLSMFAFFAVYWSTHGWPLALGLVVSIYIHEMGHVAMLKRLGIAAGAPLFIPGVGALVMLKQRVEDPVIDARIGLAGPIYGLAAGIAAYGIYLATDVPVWAAIAELTGFINLFNLTPVWQLDGSRGFHALTTTQRWAVVFALAIAYLATDQKLLLIVGAVALWRAFQRVAGPGDRATLLKFVGLIAALSWLARPVG